MALHLPGAPDPATLLAALHAGAGAGTGAGAYSPDESPLEVLQDCINGLPKVIAALPDPQDTQDATQALLILTRIQTRMMARQSQGNGSQPQG